MILNGVVSAPIELFRNFGPPVLQKTMLQEQNPLLLTAPIDLLNPRVQMIMPPLAALFAHAARQMV